MLGYQSATNELMTTLKKERPLSSLINILSIYAAVQKMNNGIGRSGGCRKLGKRFREYQNHFIERLDRRARWLSSIQWTNISSFQSGYQTSNTPSLQQSYSANSLCIKGVHCLAFPSLPKRPCDGLSWACRTFAKFCLQTLGNVFLSDHKSTSPTYLSIFILFHQQY